MIGLHRTYLSPNGKSKADISPNKMMLGKGAEGAVKLLPAKDKLIICEGIETGLSLLQAINLPVWAALSEALRLQSVIHISGESQNARLLLAWLASTWRDREFVSLRDICRRGPNKLRKKSVAQKAVNTLYDHGYLGCLQRDVLTEAGMQSQAWPILHRHEPSID